MARLRAVDAHAVVVVYRKNQVKQSTQKRVNSVEMQEVVKKLKLEQVIKMYMARTLFGGNNC